jgi:hypothetical protein
MVIELPPDAGGGSLQRLILGFTLALTCVFPVPHSAQRWILRSQTLYPIELRAQELSIIAGVSGEDQPIQSMLGHISDAQSAWRADSPKPPTTTGHSPVSPATRGTHRTDPASDSGLSGEHPFRVGTRKWISQFRIPNPMDPGATEQPAETGQAHDDRVLSHCSSFQEVL